MKNLVIITLITLYALIQRAHAVPVLPLEKTNASVMTSTIGGVVSFYVPDRAWKLTKVTAYRTASGALNGLKM
jgi:hypothetical protein